MYVATSKSNDGISNTKYVMLLCFAFFFFLLFCPILGEASTAHIVTQQVTMLDQSRQQESKVFAKKKRTATRCLNRRCWAKVHVMQWKKVDMCTHLTVW